MSVMRGLVFALLALAACHGAVVHADDISGEWRVDDVYCSMCATVDRSDVGRVLKLTPTDVDDPFAGGHCPGKLGQRDMRVTAAVAKRTLRKLNPKWLEPAAAASALRMIAVTCDGLDFITFVLLPEGHLGYLAEGEITYRLDRIHP